MTLAPLWTALLFALLTPGCRPQSVEPAHVASAESEAAATRVASTQGPGFRSRESFQSHYRKHGREFGSITADQYLALAQQLRDAPVGGPILEIVREVDGVITRYDRSSQHFGAYNADGTIRTFFIPNDGEAYFRRQALRRPQ
jgi:pyocin large subunit-like protein